MRHLDEAEVHLKQALATLPRQAAYLDTMGEIQFARGRREEALEWSKKSINYLPSDSAIRRQYHRFTSGPLPK
jgi:predicted Zn-dependent protease